MNHAKLTADIAVGSEVRSYDFESRDDCYIEGEVLEIGKTPLGHHGYAILVKKQICAGRDISTEERNLIGEVVYPPLNGSQGVFGLTRLVRKIVELKRKPHGALSGMYPWVVGEKYEIVGTLGPLVVVRIDGAEASIHPDHFM